MRLSLKKSYMCTLQSNNQCVRICTVGWISWSAVGGGDWRVVVVVVVLWSLSWRCSTDSSSVVRCWRSLGGCAELFWTSPDTSMSASLLQRSFILYCTISLAALRINLTRRLHTGLPLWANWSHIVCTNSLCLCLYVFIYSMNLCIQVLLHCALWRSVL